MFTDVPNKLEYGLIFMLFNNKTLIATSTLTVMPYDFRIKIMTHLINISTFISSISLK